VIEALHKELHGRSQNEARAKIRFGLRTKPRSA
jgi:hypothetical protein